MSAKAEAPERAEKQEEAPIDPAILAEIGGGDPNEVRRQAKELSRHVESKSIELGAFLWASKMGKYYLKWKNPKTKEPYADFESFVTEELDFSTRKARYLVSIWGKLHHELGVPAKRLERVGWSKAKDIIGIVDAKNVGEWLDKAETLKGDALSVEVKKAKGQKPSEEQFKVISFKLALPQHENVEGALDVAMAEANTEKKGHALDMICLDWLANRLKPDDKLKWLLKQVRRIYGVRCFTTSNESLYKEVLAFVDSKKKAGVDPDAAAPASPTEPVPAPKEAETP